ncbi:hypothetical protein [Streptomyces niveus]|uniref:hypothetical protein n=1 Tax=Streptomyces niveus TaxID=193462 RepID=UPI00341367AF
MTQSTLSIDELLTKMGQAYRASLPQWTPEEEAAYHQDFMNRLMAETNARLDAANIAICCLCHRERPRQPGGPRYYPSIECADVRKPWHYHRVWGSRRADAREARRHRRRVRKGRLPRVPAPAPA